MKTHLCKPFIPHLLIIHKHWRWEVVFWNMLFFIKDCFLQGFLWYQQEIRKWEGKQLIDININQAGKQPKWIWSFERKRQAFITKSQTTPKGWRTEQWKKKKQNRSGWQFHENKLRQRPSPNGLVGRRGFFPYICPRKTSLRIIKLCWAQNQAGTTHTRNCPESSQWWFPTSSQIRHGGLSLSYPPLYKGARAANASLHLVWASNKEEG